MKKIRLLTFAIIILLSNNEGICQTISSGLKGRKVNTEELKNWKLLGQGEVSTWGDQVSLQEADVSKGIMLVSPDTYINDVIVKYNVLALTPATVVVTMLSVSDKGESKELSIPEDYNGNIGLWNDEKENYFFAFKNAPHNVTPFVRKNPNAKGKLASAKENVMMAGVYYQIEIGKKQGQIWLSIDGEKLFKVEDINPLVGGHIAIRLRGTAGFKAGCLIKNLEIFSTEE